MKMIFALLALILVFGLWCCCKAAGDADDRMGIRWQKTMRKEEKEIDQSI